MDLQELIDKIRQGDIEAFWELCTQMMNISYYLCKKSIVSQSEELSDKSTSGKEMSDEEIGDSISCCIKNCMEAFDKINTDIDLADRMSEILNRECEKHNVKINVSVDELMKVAKDMSAKKSFDYITQADHDIMEYRIPAELAAEITMRLGIHNRNSDIARRMMNRYNADYLAQREYRTGSKTETGAEYENGLGIEAQAGNGTGNKTEDRIEKETIGNIAGREGNITEYRDGKKAKNETEYKAKGDKRPKITLLIVTAVLLVSAILVVSVVTLLRNARIDSLENTDIIRETFEQNLNAGVFSGIVFPSVHDEDNGECQFIWSATEESIREWFYSKYDDLETMNEFVSYNGYSSDYALAQRVYYCHKSDQVGMDGNDGKYALVVCDSTGYSSKYISGITYTYRCSSLKELMKDVYEFYDMLHLSEYSHDLVRVARYVTIATENDLGYYGMQCSYKDNAGNGYYEMEISVRYFDSEYDNYSIQLDGKIDIDHLVFPISPDSWGFDTELDTSTLTGFIYDLGKAVSQKAEGRYEYECQLGINKEDHSTFDYCSTYITYWDGEHGDIIHISTEEQPMDYLMVTIELYLNGFVEKNNADYTSYPIDGGSGEESYYLEEYIDNIVNKQLEVLRLIDSRFDYTTEEMKANLRKIIDYNDYNVTGEVGRHYTSALRPFNNGKYDIEVKNEEYKLIIQFYEYNNKVSE